MVEHNDSFELIEVWLIEGPKLSPRVYKARGYFRLHNSTYAIPLPHEWRLILSDQRDEILQMVNDGRLTAKEAADLLLAYDGIPSSHREDEPVSSVNLSSHLLVLLGVVMLIIGFFLPWIYIDVTEVLSNPRNELTNTNANLSAPEVAMSRVSTQLQKLHITPSTDASQQAKFIYSASGADIKLSWVFLLANLIVAAVSLFQKHSGSTHLAIQCVAIIYSLLIMIYIATTGVEFLSVGYFVSFIGYLALVMALTLTWRPWRIRVT
jgi:hypothetical protein